MKKILIYTLTALSAAAALASCNKNDYPVFDDKNAFVAFDETEVSANEDYSKNGDTLRVAVTLASVAGLEETVKFEISEPSTQAAKAGVNYELLTTSGTLSFDANHRTAYIEFLTKYDGIYTGDLSFTIKVYGNDEIASGSEDECKVTIADIDHPLSSILALTPQRAGLIGIRLTHRGHLHSSKIQKMITKCGLTIFSLPQVGL